MKIISPSLDISSRADRSTVLILVTFREVLRRDYASDGSQIFFSTEDIIATNRRKFTIRTPNGGLFITHLSLWDLYDERLKFMVDTGETMARAVAVLMGLRFVFRVRDNGEALVPVGTDDVS